jgi:Ala-tRNA(Pro) deacylase
MEVRMPFSNKLQSFLERNQVPYTHTTHPVAYTARGVAAAEHLPAREVAKVVIIAADNTYRMVVLPSNRVLDLTELRSALGLSHARLATEQELVRLFPDCDLGAMPPFGNLYDMPVYVDSDLALDDWIAFNAGSHVDVVHIRFRDYKWLVDPMVIPLVKEITLTRGW